MSRDPVRSDARMGGNVVRYHTWPTIRKQTVAEHTWNVMRILQTVMVNIPPEVMTYALYHDVGEVGTGDIPFPIKIENPDLKTIMDKLEDEVVLRMGVKAPPIDPHWKRIVKVCDMLEMWEFGWEELLLGNNYARLVTDRTMKVVLTMIGDPDFDVEWAKRFDQYIHDRTNIFCHNDFRRHS